LPKEQRWEQQQDGSSKSEEMVEAIDHVQFWVGGSSLQLSNMS
jgi:hypothetical protein